MEMMFEKNYYADNKITCVFGSDRRWMKISNYSYHEGIDYSNMNMQKIEIRNLISGVFSRFGNKEKSYGKYVELKHNLKFIGGADENFYSRYCHLRNHNTFSGFVKYGEKLGIMGTTGNSTGVHLHLQFMQYGVIKDEMTDLLRDIIKTMDLGNKAIYYTWQFGNLYISPILLMNYIKKIQKVNEVK